jgi:hypothetical protein
MCLRIKHDALERTNDRRVTIGGYDFASYGISSAVMREQVKGDTALWSSDIHRYVGACAMLEPCLPHFLPPPQLVSHPWHLRTDKRLRGIRVQTHKFKYTQVMKP